MPFNTNHKIQIVDASGDPCDDNSGRLKISFLDTSGDDHFGEVGAAADKDGVIHAQLHYIGNSVASNFAELETIDNSLNNIESYTGAQLITTGGQYSEGDAHTIGIVRNNALESLVTNDNDYAPLQVNAQGALYTTHGITGGADDVAVVTTAGTDVVLGGDVACKKIDIQAQTDNTGLIAVGFTGVDATEATGTGVILYAGDTYSLEVNNLNLIYIDSTEDGEGVRFTYFT